MARDEEYRRAEEEIEEARRSNSTTLRLSGRVTELPESLAQLGQLRRLFLEGTQLTALPDWLGQLSQLRRLELGINRLTALPQSLGQLSQLQSLNLRRNKLVRLPESLCQLAKLQSLNLGANQLTVLPETLGQLSQLQELVLDGNQLTVLPESLAQLSQLQGLFLGGNQLTALPASLGQLSQLQSLFLDHNQLTMIPESLSQLSQLQSLSLEHNRLTLLPESIGQLSQLQSLKLGTNHLTALPKSLGQLSKLRELSLEVNPLTSELAAVSEEGFNAVRRFLLASANGDQVALNEAKLILVGEGEVGKSCLLGALRGDPWEDDRPTTHGIEIKPVNAIDPETGTRITLNGWDFGGQQIYRPTHQLFFSSPAVYLVVWKPREGMQQGLVMDWIKLVKTREPEAKIIVVATHGGPMQRQPDIDRQEIWDLFGRETVLDFVFVESRPPNYDGATNSWVGKRAGVEELKDAVVRLAVSLPEVGRLVPRRWQEARAALKNSGAAYLPLEKVLELCTDRKMEAEEARDFVRVEHRLGHLIHYAHDPALRDIVVLKPDWLSIAMSYVLDDKQTRDSNGLVSFKRLAELWNDPGRPEDSRYDATLHPLFLRLMERFDLSYKVAVPNEPADALGFWQGIGQSLSSRNKVSMIEPQYTSLVAQLVPDVRPSEKEIAAVWPSMVSDGETMQVQTCRVVEGKNGQSAPAEGLFYQLIVRLHKYSLGRLDYKKSVHWKRGLLLDDDYNGRALLEHIGNDVRITVRAAYPEAFLAVLTSEVKYLLESFWPGLRCDVMVPCIEPCGCSSPGTALYEVQKLINSRPKRQEYPCPVCNEWQNIDSLLRNATAARPPPLEQLLVAAVRGELAVVRQQLIALGGETMGRFDKLDVQAQGLLSRVDDGFKELMQSLTDEAKEGPRLFSFQPIDPGVFGRPKWIAEKFRLTLWCEHSRLPLPVLNGKDSVAGVYELNLQREWLVKAAPLLKVLTGTLSLVLPVAASAGKLMIDETIYRGWEKELDLGQKSLEAVLEGVEKAGGWLADSDTNELVVGEAIRAKGAVLRQLHTFLKEKDASFGGLVRVRNKRQEFLWVHPQFENEY